MLPLEESKTIQGSVCSLVEEGVLERLRTELNFLVCVPNPIFVNNKKTSTATNAKKQFGGGMLMLLARLPSARTEKLVRRDVEMSVDKDPKKTS